MADTRAQREAERWIVATELPKRFGQSFGKLEVRLSWGGSFEFDAVSADRQIAGCVSTSTRFTAAGRPAIGKYHKIGADTLYLLNAVGPLRRLLVFTDPGMHAYFENERRKGRFPLADQIELTLVELPRDLGEALAAAREAASLEVSPVRE